MGLRPHGIAAAWCGAFCLMPITALKSQVTLPTDATRGCQYHPAPAAPTPSGIPEGPDNTMSLGEECLIYDRSLQMFFWLTTGLPPLSDLKYVFSFPSVFYAVTQPAIPDRYLIEELGPDARVPLLGVRVLQTGPTGTPMVFDRTGNAFSVVQPKRLITTDGTTIEIQGVTTTSPASNFSPEFHFGDRSLRFDQIGSLLDDVGDRITPSNQEIMSASGIRYRLDIRGRAIGYGTNQVDNTVLMTQSGKLVYYSVFINDVYRYYHKLNVNLPSSNGFPTDMKSVDDLSKHFSVVFPDARTLAVSLKMSWVEVSPNEKDDYSARYVLVNAEVPDYEKASEYCWQPIIGNTRSATLALVGMHIAFSAPYFENMVWATFEHVNNTINKKYKYNLAGSGAIGEHEDTKGRWVFSDTKSAEFNVRRMHMNKNGDIVSVDTDECVTSPLPKPHLKTIGPSNIRRDYPWGSSPEDALSTNNSLISANRSFIDALPMQDVRRHYLMIGVTWPNNANKPPNAPKLANSTMETFSQESQCLSCHNGAGVSGIWSKIDKSKK